MPADASSPIPLAFDQLREHPGEIPGLLERLAEAPDPRDPRGVRHALVVMLVLTACAVLTGATSLPAEATVRRLLGRIDGDALNRAVGRWLADRRAGADGRLRAVAVDGKTLRGAARATGRKIHLCPARSRRCHRPPTRQRSSELSPPRQGPRTAQARGVA
ncbi:transposase family protein [Streptomyces mirabilis]|uniref:transposase family protein n=1 Tax=Streptomyces mirabilis TaxID=68239 RepID=UPI0021BE6ECF|nr:transposase family protein [Streptomyces mirabilis]MCT9108360.1 transposase family protein [Streptomyces mirabilis]